ncbi:MAG: Spy/CpxP family protein refolding chaperone [Proteobacteria bacterium]|nr:Spy/CpxP family protein refolding chaperone [Pseudomonadota bacterium]
MRRAHHCHGAHHHRSWRQAAYGGCGGGGWRRHLVHRMLGHIDASPAQERAIIAELEKLQERARDTRFSMRDARTDLAAAMRGPLLDDAALGAVLGRVDAGTQAMRGAALDALRNIHALLDDTQRAQLADLLDRGWHGGFRGPHHRHGGHPYRG